MKSCKERRKKSKENSPIGGGDSAVRVEDLHPIGRKSVAEGLYDRRIEAFANDQERKHTSQSMDSDETRSKDQEKRALFGGPFFVDGTNEAIDVARSGLHLAVRKPLDNDRTVPHLRGARHTKRNPYRHCRCFFPYAYIYRRRRRISTSQRREEQEEEAVPVPADRSDGHPRR